MTGAKNWRWSCAVCLSAALIGFASGCQRADDNAGKKSTPNATSSNKQADDKSNPVKRPPPDPG